MSVVSIQIVKYSVTKKISFLGLILTKNKSGKKTKTVCASILVKWHQQSVRDFHENISIESC